MDNRDVTPDETLLKQIFPNAQSTRFTVILNNWDKCVFKLELESDNDQQSTYVVRLEAENENLQQFMTVAAIEKIAATFIPDLVPPTIKTGRAKNAHGRIFQFSVTEYVDGDLLEDVWENISLEEQISIVTDLANALSKLHTIRLDNKAFREIIQKVVGEESPFLFNRLGGPYSGFFDSGNALLYSIFERRKLQDSLCTLESIPQGIEIRSSYEELGSLIVDTVDMESWVQEAGLCHNDLNPRNLILRSRDSKDETSSKYRLAAIIDWELAGFYPASYQLSLQDTYLGGANRHTSFYLLLKEHMKNQVLRSPSQITLLRAMELIFTSQQHDLLDGNNISALIRKRFLDHSNLIRDEDPYTGWVRNPSVKSPVDFSGSDFDELQNAVIEEVMAARKARAKPHDLPA